MGLHQKKQDTITVTHETAAGNVVAELVQIRDLRPVDWYTGKRVAIATEDMALCDRCGARHAVVWIIDVRGAGAPELSRGTWRVGATCAKHMVFGGEIPELDAASVKAARKAAREAQQTAKRAEVLRHARRVGEALAALPTPEPECTRRGWDKYGAGLKLDQWECGAVNTTCAAGTDAESMGQNMIRRWREGQARAMLETVPQSLVASSYQAADFVQAAVFCAEGSDPAAFIRKWK